MKKFAAAVLAIILILPAIAFADFDFSFMPYADLVKLQKQITDEIMSRPEWKQVIVPPGDWIVGEDIPEGIYGLRNDNPGYINLSVWKKEVKDYSDGGLIYNELIKNGESYGKIELKKGWIVSISQPLVFTPPLSLGF